MTDTPSTSPFKAGDIVQTVPMKAVSILKGGLVRCQALNGEHACFLWREYLEPAQSAPDVAKAVAFYEAVGPHMKSIVAHLKLLPYYLAQNEETDVIFNVDRLLQILTEDNPNVL